MASIDPTSALTALIRARMLVKRSADGGGPPSETANRTQAAPEPSAGRGEQTAAGFELPGSEGWIDHRVRQIAPDDRHRRRRAFRVFLEGVLIKEFGASLLEDPAFPELIDKVISQMELDAELVQAMECAGEDLVTRAQGSGPSAVQTKT